MMNKFIGKIEREYRDFKEKMLQRTQEQIWDKCCEIYFYSCLHEYFRYNEAISYIVAMKLGSCDNIIAGCWKLYLAKEELSIVSWEDIDRLIKIYLETGEMNYEDGRFCRAA